ncbi:MAG: hypothetical protein JSW00_15555 [Thermoplasmata archaeon]|nr:MAG: hypothetical protein JSW00_15555 [Thermoplasmata archaeon]
MKKIAYTVLAASLVLPLMLFAQMNFAYAEGDAEGFEINLTNDTVDQGKCAIHGNRVVWTEEVNSGGIINWDIFLYDLSIDSDGDKVPNYLEDVRPDPDPARIRITTNTANQLNPEIHGDIIVWEDRRHGNFDVYMYDLAEDTDTNGKPNYLEDVRPDPDLAEIRITDDPADQEKPAVYGSKIVWIDKRNGNKDIFIFDVISEKETILIGHNETGEVKYRPKQDDPWIYGNKVVWLDDSYAVGSWEIIMYNLSVDSNKNGIPNYLDAQRPQFDPAVTRITTNSESESYPSINGNYIAFTRSKNIYLYDIQKKEEYKLTNSSSTQKIDGNFCKIHGTKVVWAYIYVNDSKEVKDAYIYDLALDSDGDRVPNYCDTDDPNRNFAINRITNESEQYPMKPAVFTNKIVWHDSRNLIRDIYLFNLTKNSPCEITDWTPDYIPEISDNDSFVFNIVAWDPELDDLNYVWYVNELEQEGEESDYFEYFPENGSGGVHEVKVVVSEGEYSVEKIWLINVIESNIAPPEFIMVDPVINPWVVEGEKISFKIVVGDEDSFELSSNWIHDLGLGGGSTHTYLTTDSKHVSEFSFTPDMEYDSSNEVRSYTISVNVSDGKFNISYKWDLAIHYFEDADMDGYSDEVEVAYNSDPLDATSTPPDLDGDGIIDIDDDDKDGDGLLDEHDSYPLISDKQLDGQPDYSVEILLILISIVFLVVAIIILSRISKS